jgi:hypothetical protein
MERHKGFATSRGAYYESYHFQYDGDPQKTGSTNVIPPDYPKSRTPAKWIATDVFLEVLAKGKFSLFRFQDDRDRTHYFILDEGKTEPEELLFRTYISETETRVSGLTLSEAYKQQLLVRAGAQCTDLRGKITALDYREADLKRIVAAINACYKNVQALPTVTPDKGERKRSKFGIVAEGYLTDPGFVHSRGGYDKLQFSGGISYEVFSKKRPNRISFYHELRLKNYSKEDVYEDALSVYPSKGTLSYKAIKVSNLLRVTPQKVKSPYFAGGFVWGYRFDTNINGIKPGEYSSGRDRFELGFAAGFGKRFIKIGLSTEIRGEYEFPSAQSSIGLLLCKQF